MRGGGGVNVVKEIADEFLVCRGVGEFDRHAVYRCVQPLNVIWAPAVHVYQRGKRRR